MLCSQSRGPAGSAKLERSEQTWSVNWCGLQCVMHKGLRAVLASTAALVSMPAFAWLAAELAAYHEMFSTGMHSRAELGDDLGFGILLFMVVPPFTLAGAVFVWWFVWSRTGRTKTSLTKGDANA